MAKDFLGKALWATTILVVSGMRLQADTIPTDQLLPELMIEDVAHNALMLGDLFGPDSSSPLSFTTDVNTSTLTYSYSLNLGSTYLGQSMTLSGSGTFNTAMETLYLTSSGVLGTTSWNTSGTEVVNTTVPGEFTVNENLASAGKKERDAHCDDVNFNLVTGTSSCENGYLTDKNGRMIKRSNFTSASDHLAPLPDPSYYYMTQYEIGGLGYEEFTTGTTPIGGGAGSFTLTIATIPEPSSFGLATLAVLMAGFYRRRRRG